jgi:hypothetical protein
LNAWKTKPDVVAAQLGEHGLRQAAQLAAGQLDAARGRRLGAGRDLQQTALAGAGRAHDRREAVRGELDVHVIERVHRVWAVTVDLGDVAEARGDSEVRGIENAASSRRGGSPYHCPGARPTPTKVQWPSPAGSAPGIASATVNDRLARRNHPG